MPPRTSTRQRKESGEGRGSVRLAPAPTSAGDRCDRRGKRRRGRLPGRRTRSGGHPAHGRKQDGVKKRGRPPGAGPAATGAQRTNRRSRDDGEGNTQPQLGEGLPRRAVEGSEGALVMEPPPPRHGTLPDLEVQGACGADAGKKRKALPQ